MESVSRHPCARNHRSFNTLAKCIWPKAEWVQGEGNIATVAYCNVTTVELHENLKDAQLAIDIINLTGCGGRCIKRHKLIQLFH